ncbi:hypothetical protein [Bacillus sp. UNCCL81]|uniref:hypothetical protein n=1 Tax=Bacillus sp. UNCCL81 TaxID=1502755 RepID=UPI0008EF497D|nr:hypothetical protein [Bacillus sp. UNCCL81]SFD61878.1 hypothetical protein SAMN02799633_04308 [Bacillus sp. UNCCL81]
MKIKKILSMALVSGLVLGLTGFNSTASADSEVVQKINLKPEKNSETPFDSVTYTKDGTEEKYVIKGSKKADGIIKEYNVRIDKENKTYKVEKVANPIVEKDSNSEPTGVMPLAAGTYHTAWVKAKTVDLPTVDLCYTKLTANWADYGSDISFVSQDLATWAANPSTAKTNWFLSSKHLYTAKPNSDYSKITYSADAFYYNYDFLLPNVRTDLHHDIFITANNNGTYTYDVNWVPSGEFNNALFLTVTTS